MSLGGIAAQPIISHDSTHKQASNTHTNTITHNTQLSTIRTAYSVSTAHAVCRSSTRAGAAGEKTQRSHAARTALLIGLR